MGPPLRMGWLLVYCVAAVTRWHCILNYALCKTLNTQTADKRAPTIVAPTMNKHCLHSVKSVRRREQCPCT